MTRTRALIQLLLALILLVPMLLAAAEEDNDDKDGEEEKPKTIAEVIEDSERFEGLFDLFQDREDGTIHLLIRDDQLDDEYIYFTFVQDGVVEGGHFRGAFWDNAVFSIRKHFDRIEFIKENTAFYFDPESPLSNAARANISHAVLAVEDIVAEDAEKGEYLIKANDVFLSESFTQVKPSPDPEAEEEGFSLGKLSKEKSKILELHNYPENTDVAVEYVYETERPKVFAEGEEVTDSRFISVTFRHSLIRMPENGFEPRYDDPRVGYFLSRQTDLSSTSVTPYRDMITRWDLRKKDPEADLSEPVEPITFWIENTTPYEIRDTIKRAGEAWNRAFEAAGFRNALVIREQPEDATWDAGDIRYNVLRWTSSPTPPFGGYGPSFVNPRTGQILGADIMLEFVFLTNRMHYTDVFATTGLLQEVSELPRGRYCSVGAGVHQGMLFGLAALQAMGGTDVERSQLVEEGLYFLILHEIGHTLGLNHNMKSTHFLSMGQLSDRDLTSKRGLNGSVMDYPAINYAPVGETQGQYYATTPGPYDLWAIEFGYSPAAAEPAAEAERLAAILRRSTEPELLFGNDADDMRSADRGIDPRVMIYDQSSDSIGYAIKRMQLVNEIMPQLTDRLTRDGSSYHYLRDGYLITTAEYGIQAAVISRWIGGVFVDRAMVGQPGGGTPYTPVPEDEQKRAMAALRDYLFAPAAFDAATRLYDSLQPQRRDFDFWEETEDPKVHDRVLAMQNAVLAFLLHPNTLKRVSDSALYGNTYELNAMLADLTDAVFEADARGDVNSFRRNLQVDYVRQLIGVVGVDGGVHDHLSRAAALGQLRAIRDLARRGRGDAATQGHRDYLVFLIDRALDTSG